MELTKKQSEILINSLKDVIIAICGNSVTTQRPPDKDFPAILYAEVAKYARSGRINPDLREHLIAREVFFQPSFPLGALPQDIIKALGEAFPERPSSDLIEKTKSSFSAGKAFSREHTAAYLRAKKNLRPEHMMTPLF